MRSRRRPPGGSVSCSHDAETRRESRYWKMISPQDRTAVPCWTEMEADTRDGPTCGGATTLKLAFPAPLAVNVWSMTLGPAPHVALDEKTREVYVTPGERPLSVSW